MDNNGYPDIAITLGDGPCLWYENLMAPPPTCDQPTNVSANTGATTATINWALEPDAVATQIQYRVHPSFGGSPPNTVIAGAGTTSQALSGLQPATMYQSRLRHNCDSIGISPWKFRTFMTVSYTHLTLPTNACV